MSEWSGLRAHANRPPTYDAPSRAQRAHQSDYGQPTAELASSQGSCGAARQLHPGCLLNRKRRSWPYWQAEDRDHQGYLRLVATNQGTLRWGLLSAADPT